MTSPQFNHGAHELFDVREVLEGAARTLSKYTMFRSKVKDSELLEMLDRQHAFMQQEYNTTVDCFQSGQKPAVSITSYMMKQDHTVSFGLQPKEPVKPVRTDADINDEIVSGFMLDSLKFMADLKTHAALEATNPVVRRVLADSIPDCIEMAYEVSLYQNKHGYYQVPQLPEADMKMIQQSFVPVVTQAVTQ